MNIYVGNLSLEVTEDELRRIFMNFGEVVSVTIMSDGYIGSGQPKAYGYVEMPLQAEAQVAITTLNGKALKHRAINVIQALPLSNKTNSSSHRHRRGDRGSRYIRQRTSNPINNAMYH